MLLSIIILSERPDLLTLSGASIILVSGIYTFIREGRLKQIH
jgi:drug/metabolite transporter (DMT)-like permease